MVDNLVGFDLHKKTVGIIGTGKIGRIVAHIMNGFGCKILAYDKEENENIVSKYNATYTNLNNLCSSSDIITIHVPLNEHTRYMIDAKLISIMKKGVMIINTSRGGIVKTSDVINGLQTGQIGYYGMDVYEHERGVFFYDYSEKE
jgi:D-lactate dehydrogenase